MFIPKLELVYGFVIYIYIFVLSWLIWSIYKTTLKYKGLRLYSETNKNVIYKKITIYCILSSTNLRDIHTGFKWVIFTCSLNKCWLVNGHCPFNMGSTVFLGLIYNYLEGYSKSTNIEVILVIRKLPVTFLIAAVSGAFNKRCHFTELFFK